MDYATPPTTAKEARRILDNYSQFRGAGTYSFLRNRIKESSSHCWVHYNAPKVHRKLSDNDRHTPRQKVSCLSRPRSSTRETTSPPHCINDSEATAFRRVPLAESKRGDRDAAPHYVGTSPTSTNTAGLPTCE